MVQIYKKKSFKTLVIQLSLVGITAFRRSVMLFFFALIFIFFVFAESKVKNACFLMIFAFQNRVI